MVIKREGRDMTNSFGGNDDDWLAENPYTTLFEHGDEKVLYLLNDKTREVARLERVVTILRTLLRRTLDRELNPSCFSILHSWDERSQIGNRNTDTLQDPMADLFSASDFPKVVSLGGPMVLCPLPHSTISPICQLSYVLQFGK